MSDYSHNAAMGPEHQQSDLHPVLPLRLEPLQKYTHDFRNISHGECSTSVYSVCVDPLQKYSHDFRNISHGEHFTFIYSVFVKNKSLLLEQLTIKGIKLFTAPIESLF